ncbi:MAG: branched-chain amino acid ABC transporter permease [Actinomycetes bacterium]
MDQLSAYLPLLDLVLINCGFAFSQSIVLRAGVFSLGTAGFAALGAYSATLLIQTFDVSLIIAIAGSLGIGVGSAFLLSIPLAKLRGVYQAIATLAFVQIVGAVLLFADGITRGAMGIHGIPQLIETKFLLMMLAVIVYFLWALDRGWTGLAFNAIRQDETVASSLGISVASHHTLALVLSGAIGGLYGGIQSLYVFSIEPGMYGFTMMVSVLTFVIIGGRSSILGPIVGSGFMTLLPEISRPMAEWRMLVYGLLLMLIIIFLPHGLVDTVTKSFKRRQLSKKTISKVTI